MVKSHFKQSEFRSAFTMIELIFVIVILGILAAVAIPRLGASRDDAVLVKGKSQVSAIRAGIALQKSKNMLAGTSPFIPSALDSASIGGSRLFNFADGNSSNILEYPIFAQANHDGSWSKTGTYEYTFYLSGTSVAFDYNTSSGSFDCDHSNQNCKDLAE